MKALPEKIILNPEKYFSENEKSLDERIIQVKLPDKQEEKIILDSTTKTIKDKALGLFKVGDIINTVLNWNENINTEIKGAKKDFLLETYFNKVDNLENSILLLKNLISSPQGNTIFNKILSILDNTPPDIELTKHLSNFLTNIVKTDYNLLFDKQKYILKQIESLSPQSLSILLKHESFPIFPWDGASATDDVVNESTFHSFIDTYIDNNSITDEDKKLIVRHSINELVNNKLIVAILLEGSDCEARLTDIGKSILEYLKE